MLHKKSKRWIILAIFFILGVVLTFLFKTSFISLTITTSSAERGKIIDQNGVILATNKKIKSLYYVYNIGCPADQEAAKISSFLNQFSSKFNHKISVDDIDSQLQKSCKHHDKNEIRLHANLNDKESAFINENNFKNVIVKNELIRIYPHHEIASQVIGYVDYEKHNSDSNYVPVGKNGIELEYENELKGEPGKTLTFKIKNKKFLWNIQSPQRGKDIQLALDYKLQQKTEEALRSQIQKAPDATVGYAVVIDVKTGEILTMANSPVFDPNVFNTPLSSSEKENIKLLAQNKTIQKLKYGDSYINMASTIKPLTILIGLNEKLFQPEDTYLDKGRFQYNNQNNITNAAGTPTGEITPSQAIINSSNTFMTAKVAIPLFNKNNGNIEKVATVWTNYLKQFGLRSKTGVDLPFEEEGQYKLHASSNFESGISALLNASWGANEVHTTLQLAQYAAALANKGDKYKPQIVNAIMENGNKRIKGFKPILESSNRYPSRFWNVLQSGMSQNIQEIKNLPFDVAGKTGITGSPNEQEKVINHSLFISYAPTKNPHIAISVIIPGGNPERNSAALAAAEILKAWDTLQIENKK
ncbi:penicillin-binding protein [Bacillus cereus]|nr:penicillin-binding protein [Bacillus cereus]